MAMAAKARALKAKGVRVFDFTVGEPDQPTPRHVLEAGKAAMDAGRTKYAPASGLPELRAAVTHRYREDFQVDFAPEEVTVAVGGKQALALLYQAILDRGSEVVVPIPAWPTFAEAARVAGGTPSSSRSPRRTASASRRARWRRAITPKTRAVVVNSPSNPTGAVVEPDELLKIARLAKKHGFWLLYDDTYAHLVFRPGGPPALQAVKDAAAGHLVVVGTVSKTYCMTGWRVGWVMGPRALAEACTALNSHSVQGPATFSQVAAAEALTASQDVVREMAAEYRAPPRLHPPRDRRDPRRHLHRARGRLLRVPGRVALPVEGGPGHDRPLREAARGEGGGGRPRRGLPRPRLLPALLRDRTRGPPGGRAADRRVPRRARSRGRK